MAVGFVARKCACGGTLEFDSLKKIWICKYCGTVVEREATFDKIHVDGIEGISDVVRQTLMDVANQKLDSAYRNLEACERKDHKHVGTLLAHISYHLASISAARTQDEARASLDKVKIYARRLQEEHPVIAEEEINLYEAFGDNVADIYANLIAVFDTLGDTGRFEYISSKLRPEEVFSASANKALLKISIKQNKLDVAEAVIRNTGHIDRKSSLQEILEHYPDSEKKADFLQLLFDARTAEALSKKYFEAYFAASKDSIETKRCLVALLNTTDIHCNADAVIKAVSSQIDGYDKARMVFDTIYDVKISDQETESLLVFCLIENKAFAMVTAFLDTLTDKAVFVVLSSRAVISFLDSTSFTADERAQVLQKLMRFQIDHKALDAIYNYYLNSNTDEQKIRTVILDVLLTEGAPISVNTVRNYVVNTQTDGGNKKEIVEKIFGTGINRTYLGDLLPEYLLHTADAEEQKKCIADYLILSGFKVDSSVLVQYVSLEGDKAQKLEMIKRLISNGTMVRADTVDQYILSLENPTDFSEDIFNIFTQNSYTVDFQAYAKFVLFCRDIDKVRHNEKMLSALKGDPAEQKVSVSHCGNQISCNILQAFVLNTTESYEVSHGMIQQMSAARVKLNTEISVNGGPAKFKKYVGEHKNELSPLALRLCEENKMFSLF